MYATTVRSTFINKHFEQWNKNHQAKETGTTFSIQGHVNSVLFPSRHSNQYSSSDAADTYSIFCALSSSLAHSSQCTTELAFIRLI